MRASSTLKSCAKHLSKALLYSAKAQCFLLMVGKTLYTHSAGILAMTLTSHFDAKSNL